jgi:hypothetical protein
MPNERLQGEGDANQATLPQRTISGGVELEVNMVPFPALEFGPA